MLKTPKDAQAALMLLRSTKFATYVFQWQAFDPVTLADFRASVAKIRALAGEKSHDPYMTHLLGGDVTPDPTHLTVTEKIAAGLIKVTHPSPTEPGHVHPKYLAKKTEEHKPATPAPAPTPPKEEPIPPGLVAVGVVTGIGAIAGLAWMFSSKRKKKE
jgi:hypothetical protein